MRSIYRRLPLRELLADDGVPPGRKQSAGMTPDNWLEGEMSVPSACVAGRIRDSLTAAAQSYALSIYPFDSIVPF